MSCKSALTFVTQQPNNTFFMDDFCRPSLCT